MGDQTKNILIGLFCLTALVIMIFVLLFLNPKTGDEGQTFKARFANIDKVNVGTRVNYGGKAVGEVIKISQIENPPGARELHEGRIYNWELTLRVDSHVKLQPTDIIDLRTSGLLGEKSVSIMPNPTQSELSQRENPQNIENHIIYANESASIEETMKDFQLSARKLDLVLDSTYELIGNMNKRKLGQSLSDTIENLNDISSALNNPEQLSQALSDMSDGLSVLREGLEDLKDKDTWNNIGDSADNLRSISGALNKPEELSETINNIHELSGRVQNSWLNVDQAIQNFSNISENVARGEGSVGHIFVKDDLYLHLSSLLSKAETVMDDINHYGLLFHLDKGWQKLRARRANLLQKLSTPQEFRNYFNDEIDQITTSLSRVYMVLRKFSDTSGCKYSPGQDGEFTRVFAELLRRTKELQDGLEMYNEQAMDFDASCCCPPG
jgi:phospholipid/cholesterol/gamma-HCH transport system substrate-binding protein